MRRGSFPPAPFDLLGAARKETQLFLPPLVALELKVSVRGRRAQRLFWRRRSASFRGPVIHGSLGAFFLQAIGEFLTLDAGEAEGYVAVASLRYHTWARVTGRHHSSKPIRLPSATTYSPPAHARSQQLGRERVGRRTGRTRRL